MYFSSRDLFHRSPFGAVAADVPVHFKLRLPRSFGCSAAELAVGCAGGEDSGGAFSGMFWCGEQDGEEFWECHYTPAVPDSYRYCFRLTTAAGVRWLSKTGDGSADMVEREDAVRRWVLTVYDPAFTTPDWLAGGIIYQIFPDRFAASGKPKTGVPIDRRLREDWGGQPQWQPDARGRIRNDDYFGGDLAGIAQRLDRLAELGITALYLNPIFEAHSNHRYDTADYEKIDPLLGDETDFRNLCEKAAALGIRVILDGVFSHTGADSKYFNRERRYQDPGAYHSPSSPYATWYHFNRWPGSYTGWWGFDTLPEVDEMAEGYQRYMLGEDGIVRQWLRAGASGWRLDVADELPDGFLDPLRTAVKAEKPGAVIIGEVWEDAATKTSYGHPRRYLLGGQLDSVMNYPFRDAVLDFLTDGGSAGFFDGIFEILEHYPTQVIRLLMNLLGTHDTERALTVLGGEYAAGRGRKWQSEQKMTPEQRQRGLRRMKLAAALQYCLPGVPSVYYGDEAGAEGYRDPFNRGCYPWGKEDAGLLDWYRKLGQLRHSCPALREGKFSRVNAPEGVVAFLRMDKNPEKSSALLCAVNREEGEHTLVLPPEWHGRSADLGDGWVEEDVLHIPGEGCVIMHNS
ncbi:MAG: glycoside hydrolase family 13 protein [Oscillospiraceae bacterium]|nr:glycoside hydrolase family 13 protein [Oscillospiraceae bacterium]